MSAGEGTKRNWIDTLNATWNKQKTKTKTNEENTIENSQLI